MALNLVLARTLLFGALSSRSCIVLVGLLYCALVLGLALLSRRVFLMGNLVLVLGVELLLKIFVTVFGIVHAITFFGNGLISGSLNLLLSLMIYLFAFSVLVFRLPILVWLLVISLLSQSIFGWRLWMAVLVVPLLIVASPFQTWLFLTPA